MSIYLACIVLKSTPSLEDERLTSNDKSSHSYSLGEKKLPKQIITAQVFLLPHLHILCTQNAIKTPYLFITLAILLMF